MLILASVAVATIGIVVAWRLFGVELGPLRTAGARPSASASSTARVPFLYRASLNKWWFDDLNHLLFVVIGGRIADAPVVVRPERRRRHGQRHRRGRPSAPAAACAGSRPAASRTTPSASPSG